ncbi:hypothetical protein L1987_83548 [Smallanthus sonchifolius]|uniref:Uncharacterized protein n=1 Tax=Smallanthus sonchifolius TaxID=185202 RepID=A0ACB8YCW7_9ASTR|nr:hypothetical protein L1987_83548 [Smallanthus sonchifolius]
MEKNETGCQTDPVVLTLCVNDCGFFGTPATMNMCSKCFAVSVRNIFNGILPDSPVSEVALSPSAPAESSEKPNPGEDQGQGPPRCTMCKKRVGLTGFNCRCGNVFCNVHRYSDKHECKFDYRATAKDAIAKANPVVKPEKLDKI